MRAGSNPQIDSRGNTDSRVVARRHRLRYLHDNPMPSTKAICIAAVLFFFVDSFHIKWLSCRIRDSVVERLSN